MTFPFEVPADLTALSAEEFAAFRTQVREFAQTTLADEAATSETLVETSNLFKAVEAEGTRRTELAAQADAARLALSTGLQPTEPAPAPQPEPAPEPAPVPAPEPTGTDPVPAVTASTIDPAPETPAKPQYASMTASADAPGNFGQLTEFAQVGDLLERRLASYSTSINRKGREIVPVKGAGVRTVIGGRSLQRHGGVTFNREFPAELRITGTDAGQAEKVLNHAIDETRLEGGSLVKAVEAGFKRTGSLTAAVGWCAPSETIYDLCELETMDGMLDIPEVEAARGGFFVPENGGPDFSVIYDSIGDDGDVILTEYDVENGAEKVCVEIPCPDFVEVRLDVAYICITGSLLQRRGYPEAVARFSRGAMVALAHKVNESVIARIVAQSGSVVTISADASGDDAVSALLSAIELAIEDMKYRHRMGRTATMEVVLPAWVIAPMRAALARRAGVAEYNVTDAQILAAFTTRRAVPRFVYDWQDAFSGQANSPGGATPITAFPANVDFLVYPAGTWVKPVRSVVNLDTVYDNALLTQNQYTALFAEDGFNVLKMCAESRHYRVPVDPSGVVGCCP